MFDPKKGKNKPAYRIYKGTPSLRMELDRCPAAFVTQRTLRVLMLFGHFTHGRFPVGGGVMDQSHTILEAFELLEGFIAASKKG